MRGRHRPAKPHRPHHQSLAGASYDFDFNRQILSIEIPPAYLGSIPFEVRRRQWRNGEQLAFTN